MQNNDERVLSIWAIGKELRRGILIGILGLLIVSNGIIFYKYDKLQDERAQFYERMILRVDEKVGEKLEEPIRDMKRVTNKADTVAERANSAVEQLLKSR